MVEWFRILSKNLLSILLMSGDDLLRIHRRDLQAVRTWGILESATRRFGHLFGGVTLNHQLRDFLASHYVTLGEDDIGQLVEKLERLRSQFVTPAHDPERRRVGIVAQALRTWSRWRFVGRVRDVLMNESGVFGADELDESIDAAVTDVAHNAESVAELKRHAEELKELLRAVVAVFRRFVSEFGDKLSLRLAAELVARLVYAAFPRRIRRAAQVSGGAATLVLAAFVVRKIQSAADSVALQDRSIPQKVSEIMTDIAAIERKKLLTQMTDAEMRTTSSNREKAMRISHNLLENATSAEDGEPAWLRTALSLVAASIGTAT